MYSEIYFMVPLILLIALTLDIVIGWPEKVYENIGHPVTWIGKVISYFEHLLNKREYSKKSLKLLGTLTFFLTVFPITAIAFLIEYLLLNFNYGFVIQALLIWPFLATKSLYTHVKDVADALDKKDLIASRAALSKIVGRDLTNSDENTICGGAIESLSENTSDGIIAPLFWAFLFGLPGIVFYKAINTLDSMVGYKNNKFLDFGWFSANVDDFVNWVPARLSSILFCAQMLDGHKQRSRTFLGYLSLGQNDQKAYLSNSLLSTLGTLYLTKKTSQQLLNIIFILLLKYT